MRTYFIVSEKRVNKHVGEEYDAILEVEDQPTTETMPVWFNRVRDRIRALWMEQKDEPEKLVVVHFDATGPFNAMLLDLQHVLKVEERIIIELPYSKTPQVDDQEARELLTKLDGKIV